ncbi:MAG: hypothetical protein WA194_03215 [Patescibacteria group bacterium]
MEKGFVCVVKAASHSDNAFLRDFGGRFPVAEKYGTSECGVLWCGDRPPFPYCLGAAAVGATSEYPVSTVTVDPSAPSVTVRADALGFKSPFVAAASGMVFLSDSVSALTAAAAFFDVRFEADPDAVLAGLAYQSLPVGRTFLRGVSSQQ